MFRAPRRCGPLPDEEPAVTMLGLAVHPLRPSRADPRVQIDAGDSIVSVRTAT